MSIRIYKTGGWVRDHYLGLPSKDLDLAVEAPSYQAMYDYVIGLGCTIFQERPQFVTIRANHPQLGPVDFVLCRKDGAYSDGRHPDSVTVGSIYDDLARRDFTVNAMAIREDGTLLDPHNGLNDLQNKLLICVGGDSFARFNEDPLRMLRAIRFAVTRKLDFSSSVDNALKSKFLAEKYRDCISPERTKDELEKALRCNTLKTLRFLSWYPYLNEVVFSGRIWLKPTMESK